MGIKDAFKSIFNPDKWTDKSFIANEVKSFPVLTNEIISYGLSPVDRYIGSVDYRGADNPLTNGYSSRNFLELFDCIPEIFAPIHAIASRIANADFQLRKNTNDEVIYDNEDWNRLFNTPNPLQHFRELVYEAVVYQLVTGNEYMYFNTPSTLNRDFRNVAAIWNLPADKITQVTNSSLKLFTATTIEDIVTKYKLDDKNYFETKDVLHIKNINLKWDDRKLKGRSPLLSADKAVANLIAVYEARNVIYTKRGALGAIVSRKSDASGMIPLPKSERDKIREEMNGTYGVTGNRSPFVVTDQPVDFIRFGMSITELQPFEETYLDAKMIYSVLGVPEDLMPNQTGATFENQIQAERRLYNGTVIPLAMSLTQSIGNKLGLNEASLYLHPSFEGVEALQENKKEKAEVEKTIGETYLNRFLHGVAPLNEWIVATGNDKATGPIFEKRLFEMDETELAQVKAVLQLKGVSVNQNNNGDTGTDAGNQGQGAAT